MSKDNTKGFATLVKEISQFAEERESGWLSANLCNINDCS